MREKVSFTALVTGIPPSIHGPQLQQGENVLQFLVRHYPYEWKILIKRLRNDVGVPAHICGLLQSLKIDEITDPTVKSEVEKWASLRVPKFSRTLKSLSQLRELLEEEGLSSFKTIDSLQILWPREKDPSGNTRIEKEAAALGAEIIWQEAGLNREMDIGGLISYVKGAFLWLVPGGAHFMAPLVVMSLERVLRAFDSNPLVATYFDGSYCIIYRVSAIKEVLKENGRTSATHGEIAKMLQAAGYLPCADSGPEDTLCEIEEIYGGNDPFPKPTKTSWLRRLFGR